MFINGIFVQYFAKLKVTVLTTTSWTLLSLVIVGIMIFLDIGGRGEPLPGDYR